MHGKYMEKFNIIETYKNTDFQKIFIASTLEDNKPVLINILSHRRLIDSITLDLLENTFDNLIYLEKSHGNIVFVIKFNDNPIPLDIYLDKNPTMDNKDRINLVYNYLNKLVQYDELPNSFKESLVDISQISIKNNNVFLDEIIVLNENFLDNDNFIHIKEEVGKVIEKIISKNNSYIDDDPIIAKILNFAKNLSSMTSKQTNFRQILNSYKNIFLYDFLHNKITDSLNGDSVNDIDSNVEVEKSRKFNFKAFISTAIIIALLITTYAYLSNMKNLEDIMDDDKILQVSDDNDIDKPTAYFEKNEENGTWTFTNKSFSNDDNTTIEESVWQIIKDNEVLEEITSKDLSLKFKESGLYTISLKVRNSNNNWSDDYTQVFNIVLEQEDISDDDSTKYYASSLDIHIPDNKFVSQDKSVYRNSNFSFKFEPNTTENPSKIGINNLDTEKNLHLSMWLKCAGLNPLTIHLNGYNEMSQLIYRKNIKYQPSLVNSWDMVAVDLGNNKIHSMEVLISNNSEEVWIADIEIDVYK